MAIYKYELIQSNGKKKKGTIEAPTREAAEAELKIGGSTIVSLAPAGAMSKDIEIHIGKVVKPREMSVFCRQFESVLNAGVTAVDALDMLAAQTKNKSFKKALVDIRDRVQKGESLGEAMMNYPKIFPEMMVQMVIAGEASGSLEVAFGRMAVYFEKSAKLSGQITKAMIYPIILILVIIVVVVVMMVKIVPTFTATFDELDAKLPAITLFVMAVSGVFQHYWFIMLAVVIALAVFFSFFKKTEMGAHTIGWVMLHAPLFGNLTTKNASAQFASTLSTLMAAGINMVDAVEIVQKIIGNQLIKTAMQKAHKDVQIGIPLSKPLEESGVFPPMVYQMVQIGEETGKMEDMLDKISSYYDEEVAEATAALMSAMEPLIIIVMAVVVVPIVLAIMLPMYSMYDQI